jgi:hypothetical protein
VLTIGALVCHRWAPETRHAPLAALDEMTQNLSHADT